MHDLAHSLAIDDIAALRHNDSDATSGSNDSTGRLQRAQALMTEADDKRDEAARIADQHRAVKAYHNKLLAENKIDGEEQREIEAAAGKPDLPGLSSISPAPTRQWPTDEAPYDITPIHACAERLLEKSYLVLPTKEGRLDGAEVIRLTLKQYKPKLVTTDQNAYYVVFTEGSKLAATRIACWGEWRTKPFWLFGERLLMELRKKDDRGEIVYVYGNALTALALTITHH